MANQTVKLTQHEIRQVLQVLVWAQGHQYYLFNSNFGAEAFDLNSAFEKLVDAACLPADREHAAVTLSDYV